MTIIDELHNLNDSIVDLSLDYSVKKLGYKEEEAHLLLETDFEEVLGKKRPTVAEKEAYVLLQLKDLKAEVDKAYYELEAVKRGYEIKKIECKMTGNFLNTVAGVVDDDD